MNNRAMGWGHKRYGRLFAAATVVALLAYTPPVQNAPAAAARTAQPASAAARGADTWAPTGTMSTPRYNYTATLLRNGQVLATGGYGHNGNTALSSAELYTLATGTWAATASMFAARTQHVAVLLTDGTVLVAGGIVTNRILRTAEYYDSTHSTWVTTGPMNVARYAATATLLPNGQVLVAGGLGAGFVPLASAELYDPAIRRWSLTGAMSSARAYHTATLLPNGTVLVAGGCTAVIAGGCGNSLASAEIYDPATGTWAPTGAMSNARAAHTATLLSNGRVLVAAGESGPDTNFTVIPSAELYDPATGTWMPTGTLSAARAFHTATLLPDGQVLVAGGCTITDCAGAFQLASAELYDPRSGVWASTNNMLIPNADHTATLLSSGQVLVAGGQGGTFYGTARSELYTPGPSPLLGLDPPALSFGSQLLGLSSAPFTTTLVNTGALTLTIKSIAITGTASTVFTQRNDCTGGPLAPHGSCRVVVRFAPATAGPLDAAIAITDNAPASPQSVGLAGTGAGPSTWFATGSMASARYVHTATLLQSGQVLVAGGCTGNLYNCAPLTAAEVYNPTTGTFSLTGAMSTARYGHTATLLPTGKVLVAGGCVTFSSSNGSCYTTTASAELYDPSTGTWTATGAMVTSRYEHTATLLPTGKVLVAAGGSYTGTGSGMNLDSAELYDPATGTFATTGTMTAIRSTPTATLLPNGTVLVAGGSTLPFAELYDPGTGHWSITGAMVTPRDLVTAALLPSGKVLVAGGADTSYRAIAGAELYDPGTNTWTATGSMPMALMDSTLTVLRDGTVLAAGGDGGCCTGSATATAELYDPATGTWSYTGNMTTGRQNHTATLLTDGQVLVVGGITCWNCNTVAGAELYAPVTLAVHPSSGSVGQTVAVTGTYFAPNEKVTLRWDSTTGTPLVTATASSGGAFVVSPAIPPAAAGKHEFVASGENSGRSAVAAFMVKP